MSINSFEPSYQNQGKQDEPAKCAKCECTWFEQFQVKQLKVNHSAVLGQTIPPANDFQFTIIRCIKCGEKYQPNIIAGREDQEFKSYSSLLDSLEEKAVEEPIK
jgi:hypothetical protein